MIEFEQLLAEIDKVIPIEWNGIMPVISMGSGGAKQRLYLDVGCHGQEFASPLALRDFAKKYGQDWKWPNVQVLATIVDPPGMEEVGYGFLGVDGKASCWPPLWGYRQDNNRYWTHVDYNSAWGNIALGHLSRIHRIMRGVLTDYKPTFLLSLHETVENETDRSPFWCGCGLMVLELYPVSPGLQEALVGIPNPARDVIGFCGYLFRRWFTFLTGQPRWKRNVKILGEHKDFNLISDIVKRYVAGGNPLFGKSWQRVMELQGYVTTGLGRAYMGGLRESSDWMTIMDYAARQFGIPAVTTETFPVGEIGLIGIDKRKRQQLAFIEATLDVLNDVDD